MKTDAALKEASVDWSPSVTSGYADTYPKSEWETEDSPPGDRGLEDKEKQNAPWEQEKPKAAQDYQVKEEVRLAIEKGLKENSDLRQYVTYLEEQLETASRAMQQLRNEVADVNLFNTKVLKVNEMLNKFGKKLTNEQKKVVIEKIDAAQTVREVAMVSEALKAAYGSQNQLKEGAGRRSLKPNASRPTSSGSPNQKVLRESVDNSGRGAKYSRWTHLAGLVQ